MKYTQASFELFVQSLTNEQKFFLGLHIDEDREHSISRLQSLIDGWFATLSNEEKLMYAFGCTHQFSKEIDSPYR